MQFMVIYLNFRLILKQVLAAYINVNSCQHFIFDGTHRQEGLRKKISASPLLPRARQGQLSVPL